MTAQRVGDSKLLNFASDIEFNTLEQAKETPRWNPLNP